MSPAPAAGAHEVWARVAWAAVDLASMIDLPAERLLAGLPYGPAELRRRKRVSWDDYCVMVERIGDAAGGPREIEDLLAADYHRVAPELRTLAGGLLSPRAFIRFVVDVLDPLVFPPIAFEYEDLPDDCIRVVNALRPGARPCEVFFHGSTGALRGVTAHLGLPLAEVVASDVGPTGGEWVLRLPASRTVVRRARRAAEQLIGRFVFGSTSDGTPIAMTVGEVGGDASEQRLDRATDAWKLTPRQAEVLELVVAGLSNKEVAHRLGCADNTVELHITRVLRKAAVMSRSQLIARFWSEPWGLPG